MTNSWKRRIRNRRRGVATIWFLAAMPALIALLLVLLELGHLYAARVELENALEASALAAVKTWGSGGGTAGLNWTNTARLRGQALASYNFINGNPVVIGTNLGTFNSGTNPNENAAYLPAPGQIGNLVFGAVTESGNVLTFNSTQIPVCGGARVLVDTSGNGSLFSSNRNDWGIAFQDATDLNLRIVSITFNLATATSPSVFHNGPELSTAVETSGTAAVHDSTDFQTDIRGFDDLTPVVNSTTGQMRFAANPDATTSLTLNFFPSSLSADPGFQVGDRIRFSQDVHNATNSNQQRDGDDIVGMTITITFSDGSIATGQMPRTDAQSNDCHANTGAPGPNGPMIVHPANVPDLPCPPNSSAPSANNDGQSWLLFQGGGGPTALQFAVRAQGAIAVPSLFGSYFGGIYSTHNVTVDTTAIYDCATGRTRLVRIDTYTHP